MDCVICSTSLLHLFHEPMSMGCKCQERLCQRCFKVGDVHKCPTCRKPKKQPKVDRKWLKREWKQGQLVPCLGCEKEVYSRYIHKHEMRCTKYRNLIHNLFEEDMRMRRVQNEQNQTKITEMESRLDLQSDLIEDLEEQVEDLQQLTQRQEEERQLYVVEHSRLLRSLQTLMGPLYASLRSMDSVYTRVSQATCSLRASRAHHQLLRRQQSQNHHHQPMEEEHAAPVPPPPPPFSYTNTFPGITIMPPAYQPPPPSEPESEEAAEDDASPAQSPYRTPPSIHPPHFPALEDSPLEDGEVVEEDEEEAAEEAASASSSDGSSL